MLKELNYLVVSLFELLLKLRVALFDLDIFAKNFLNLCFLCIYCFIVAALFFFLALYGHNVID